MHPAVMALVYQQLAARRGLAALATEQAAIDDAVPAGETSPAASAEPVKRGPGRPRKEQPVHG